MIIVPRTALALVLAGGLAACGGGESNNQAAEPTAIAEATNTSADASNPFAQSERTMNDAMMAAVGTDAGDTWAKKIVPHHQGAIDMSEIVLQQNPTADVGKMAQMTIEKQTKDIEDIRKLFKDGAPNQQTVELYRQAMMGMHQKMQAATGANASETFMRKMLEHHRGGVAMSDIALKSGVSGALREQIQKTREDQQKDAEMVEAMLQGQSHEDAMRATGAKSAQEAKKEPAPAEKSEARTNAKSTSKPAPKTAPTTTTKTDKPSVSDCAPEHREAGHC
jgi:uncharacterized protein (DUF305 family)